VEVLSRHDGQEVGRESSSDHYWKYPVITRNEYGKGTLTYEGSFLTDALQRGVIQDVLKRAGLCGPDQDLPEVVKVRHGINAQGKTLHYYLNFSGEQRSFVYPYADGVDLLTKVAIQHGRPLSVGPWDVSIIEESAGDPGHGRRLPLALLR
jgi:beta-galactosidase